MCFMSAAVPPNSGGEAVQCSPALVVNAAENKALDVTCANRFVPGSPA